MQSSCEECRGAEPLSFWHCGGYKGGWVLGRTTVTPPPQAKVSVVIIFDATGVINYNDGDAYYSRTDMPGRFVLLLNGSPLTFVDSFRYLGVLFHKSGDFQNTVNLVARTASGKMWAI